ncbi:hypothetical protein KBC55_02970 [Patescibacteria group bacterium]|nr:hypothetical protein [Patescibacteria group bacterium]
MGRLYVLAIFGLILALIAPIISQFFTLGAQLAGLGYLGILAILAKPPQGSNSASRLATGALTGISLLAIATSAVYYLSSITVTTLSFATITTLTICLAIAYKNSTHAKDVEKSNWRSILATVIVTLPLIASLFAMSSHPILDAVRTPWTAQNIFPVLAPIALSVFLTITLRAKKILTPSAVTLLIGLTAFTITSFAALAYPLGYGFDPHVHRATLEHIAEHGTITPKPPYYIAMYGLELTANMLFGFTLSAVDPLLAPMLFALTVMIAIGTLMHQKISGLVTLALVPLSAFIQTTPNAVSLALLVATIVSSVSKDISRSWLFAFAALLAHPIAGLPALIVALTATITSKLPERHKNIALISAFFISAFTLPAAFVMDAHLAQRSLEFVIPTITTLTQNITPTINLLKQGNAPLDTIYSLASILSLITFALVVYGYKHASKNERLFGALSLGTLCSALIITTTLRFSYLISYEQNDFALRAVTIANLLALPLLLKGSEELYKKVTLQKTGFQIGTAAVVALILAVSTYLAYPRHDAYANSSGFNVSQSDVQAVQIIETYANQKTYAVLGNQAISAAAITTFGFSNRYLANDTYFYPIPTSSPLYADFLAFTEIEQSQKVIDQAFERTDAELIIVVVHDYWWDTKNITQNATAIADDVLQLPDGLHGFAFTKNAP